MIIIQTEKINSVLQLLKRINEISLNDYQDLQENELQTFVLKRASCPKCSSNVHISFFYAHPGFPPSTSFYIECERGDWKRKYNWNVFNKLSDKNKKLLDNLDVYLKQMTKKGIHLGECGLGGSLFLISADRGGCIQPIPTTYTVNCTHCGEGIVKDDFSLSEDREITSIFEEAKKEREYWENLDKEFEKLKDK